MPPGMIMDRDTPAEAMMDMAAVDPRQVTASYDLEARGGRELEPRIEGGVKVFTLTTSVFRWPRRDRDGRVRFQRPDSGTHTSVPRG
jgi:manganese oxidase